MILWQRSDSCNKSILLALISEEEYFPGLFLYVRKRLILWQYKKIRILRSKILNMINLDLEKHVINIGRHAFPGLLIKLLIFFFDVQIALIFTNILLNVELIFYGPYWKYLC